MEGKTKGPGKLIPPIKEGLLSTEFLEEFNRGRLSVKSLSIVCPKCGTISKAFKLAVTEHISKAKCLNPNCNQFIDDLDTTLRYYCGYILPDSNIINGGLLSKDLSHKKFFQDFTIVIPAVIRKECEGKGGKSELGRLATFASMSRVKLEEPGRVKDVPDGLSSLERDELIIESTIKYNAIFITGDNPAKARTVSKELFTIFV